MVGVERFWHPAGDGENLFSSALSHIVPNVVDSTAGVEAVQNSGHPAFSSLSYQARHTSVFPLNDVTRLSCPITWVKSFNTPKPARRRDFRLQ